MSRQHFGRYETLRPIASGGMASVYLGRALGPAGFERLVAIKVMHEHIVGDPDFRTMFLDEARLAARIRHPNVVPTLDVAEDGRFLVMEYVEGASLREVLRRRRDAEAGPIAVDVALRVALDVIDGLHAAHELADGDGGPLNLVHRDVSPHNILVGVDGVSRITDFGIAFAEARMTNTKSGQLKGKMPYMAPEQLDSGGVDRRVDVYAAACVLWEMLAGRRLFVADSEAALARKVLAGPPHGIREVNAAVPEAVDAACMQALASPETRFRSALAFAEALEGAARDVGIAIARPRLVAELVAFAREGEPRRAPSDPPRERSRVKAAGTTEPEGTPLRLLRSDVGLSASGGASSERGDHTGLRTSTAVAVKLDDLPLAARPIRLAGDPAAVLEPLADDPADEAASARSIELPEPLDTPLAGGTTLAPSQAIPTRPLTWVVAVVGAGALVVVLVIWLLSTSSSEGPREAVAPRETPPAASQPGEPASSAAPEPATPAVLATDRERQPDRPPPPANDPKARPTPKPSKPAPPGKAEATPPAPSSAPLYHPSKL
jgi:serine/threonine-protein kinase